MKQLQAIYQKMAPDEAYSVEALVKAAGQPEAFVRAALRELVNGGLVEKRKDEFSKASVFRSKQMGLLS